MMFWTSFCFMLLFSLIIYFCCKGIQMIFWVWGENLIFFCHHHHQYHRQCSISTSRKIDQYILPLLFFVPKGGFITIVSNFFFHLWHGKICCTSHCTSSKLSDSNSTQFLEAISKASLSMSNPIVIALPRIQEPMLKTPQPQPKSPTSFPSMSPKLVSIVYNICAAMCGVVGYCSRSTFGFSKPSTCCRYPSNSLSLITKIIHLNFDFQTIKTLFWGHILHVFGEIW